MNLFEILKSSLGSAGLKALGDNLGKSPEAAERDIMGAAAGLFSSLSEKMEREGNQGVFDFITKDKNVNANLFSDPTKLLSAGGLSKLSGSGDTILKSLFGNGLGNVVTLIGRMTGLSRAKSSGLMGLVGPMVLGVVKNKLLGSSMGAGGLYSLLKNQQTNYSNLTAGAGGGGLHLGKWLPLAALLLAGIVALPFLKNCGGVAIDQSQDVGAVVKKIKPMEIVKKGADFFKFKQGTVAASFADFLSDGATGSKTFVLDKVEFNTGSADLRETSQAQLERMIQIIQAYKETKFELQGHTDSTGNEDKNIALSAARAEAVSSFLQSKGVDASRLSAKGFGPSTPRDTNDTAEGRQKNRRTEIRAYK